MKTFLPLRLLWPLLLFCFSTSLFAQTTPFALPPKWYFGHRAGIDFTSGTPVLMGGNTWDGGPPNFDNQENSTTACFPNRNVALYSNSCQMKDATHAVRGDNPLYGGGNSSTQGCVAIPDPASPTNRFILITAAVEGGGGSNCGPTDPSFPYGMYVYRINTTTTPMTVSARTLLFLGQALAAGPLNESIAVSSDLEGGYWIVTVNYTASQNIRFISFHIDKDGVLSTTPVASPTGNLATGEPNFRAQGSVVISKCNNRIGYVQHGTNGNNFWVYNWDAATGRATTAVRTGRTGNTFNYGCEFSPDGNILYTTGLNGGDKLMQITLPPNALAINDLGSSDAYGNTPGWGNLKLGPDDKIYISHKYTVYENNPKYLGVIGTPNSVGSPGYAPTGFTITTGGQTPSVPAGLITLGWYNPTLPISFTSTPDCHRFSYQYLQYFGTSIPVLAGSPEWDFGSGWETGLGNTPTRALSDGTHTVKLRVKDQTCQIFYTSERSVTVSCPMPVEWVDFTAEPSGDQVLLTWTTATETRNSHYIIQYSTDGENYTTLGRVESRGSGYGISEYDFAHATPSNGNNYYRIIQYDTDGTSTSSGVRSVNLSGLMISVFPNPSAQDFTLSVSGASQVQIRVVDIVGHEVYQAQTTGAQHTFGSTLPPGVYSVLVYSGSTVKTVKVVKN